jgi:hypothetical protein
MSPPCAGLKSKPSKKTPWSRQQAELASCSFLDWLTLQPRTSETSVDFHQTTWCYIPEDRTHRNHHCENLKSCSFYVIYMLFGFTFKIILPQNLLNQELCWGPIFLFTFLFVFAVHWYSLYSYRYWSQLLWNSHIKKEFLLSLPA